MNSRNRMFRIIAALAFTFLSPLVSAVPVFTNASFETGNSSGWTEINSFIGVQNINGFSGGNVAAQQGTYGLWLGATDTGFTSHLLQTVSGFTVGNNYSVTFGLIAEGGSQNGRPGAFAQVNLTNASLANQAFSIVDTDCSFFSSDQCLGGWQDKAFSFTALNSAVTFDFSGDARPFNSSWEMALDNFRIAEVNAVPEPGSIMLIFAALLGFIATRRRTR